MPIRLLLIISCLSAPAFADAEECQAVRQVLALALRQNLNTGDLPRLEQQVCGKPEPSACLQLEAFWMLSLALEQSQEVSSALEAQRGTWCGKNAQPSRPLQWPDGRVLRSSSGTLSWPDGTMARSSSGTWYAPTGTMVRSSSGSLSYPQGTQARSSSGRWSLPSGELAEEGRIASLACARDAAWCRFFLGELSRESGPSRDFAQLGLGWRAR